MKKPAKNAATVYLSKWSEGSDTRKAMRGALNRIAGVLDEGKDAETYPWHELRYDDVRAIPAMLADEELEPATINKALSALRGVLEVAWRSGAIPDEEYRRIDIENVRGGGLPSGRALAPDEVDAVAASLPNVSPEDAALLAVLLSAGLRRVEAVKLVREDYDPATGRLTAYGKGRKKRSIPVGTRWRAAIEAWRETLHAGAVMFNMNRRQVSYVVECFCTNNGLKPFTPHDLRRTFATHICRVADIAVAQRLLGHANMQTTGIYDRRGEEVEDKAVKDL